MAPLRNLSRMTQGMSVLILVLVLKSAQNGPFLSLSHRTLRELRGEELYERSYRRNFVSSSQIVTE